MTPRPTEEGWQRNVWALSLCVFIAFVGFQFFSPFLPLYVIELGVTDPTRVALWSDYWRTLAYCAVANPCAAFGPDLLLSNG